MTVSGNYLSALRMCAPAGTTVFALIEAAATVGTLVIFLVQGESKCRVKASAG